MRFSFLAHPLRFFLAEARGSGDGDFLFLVRRGVFRRDVQYAVRIDVERHLNLRYAAWSRWNSDQMEFPKRAIATGYRPFSLKDMNLDGRLSVRRGRKYLRLPRRDRGVAWNQYRRHAAQSFDAQRQRR